jgi:uncharacterized OsmC-like protein
MLTVMGITAQRKGIDMRGAKATVDKDMASEPRRRIGHLGVRITMPSRIAPESRRVLEATARACPVASSLGESTQVDVEFVYEEMG